jgi:hypothetical protein
LTNDINKKLKRLINETKSEYITQGVSFNKRCDRQMKLLELALIDSVSFSGLVKEMLAIRYEDSSTTQKVIRKKSSKKSNLELDKVEDDLFENKEIIKSNWLR